MLGWVTDRTGGLQFTQGGKVPQSKAVWDAQRTRLQAVGFRVHAYKPRGNFTSESFDNPCF